MSSAFDCFHRPCGISAEPLLISDANLRISAGEQSGSSARDSSEGSGSFDVDCSRIVQSCCLRQDDVVCITWRSVRAIAVPARRVIMASSSGKGGPAAGRSTQWIRRSCSDTRASRHAAVSKVQFTRSQPGSQGQMGSAWATRTSAAAGSLPISHEGTPGANHQKPMDPQPCMALATASFSDAVAAGCPHPR